MKMTQNRKLILQALAESDQYDKPPYSASSVRYTLENAFNYQWQGYNMKTLPSLIQIHRTLKDLWHGGAIVGTRFKGEVFNGLPCWVVRYQLSCDVEKNHIISECQKLHQAVSKAKNGFNFFGGVFDKGLPASEVKPLADKVRMMMQRTHPDKSPDYSEQEMIKSGIPEPMPTYSASDTKQKANKIERT